MGIGRTPCAADGVIAAMVVVVVVLRVQAWVMGEGQMES
jgi:hypothetical protein